jgi:hypothetical protein
MNLRWRILGIRWTQLAFLLSIGLVLAACNRSTPTPMPPATVVPTATSAPVETSDPDVVDSTPTFESNAPTPETSTPGVANGSITAGAIFTSPRYSYTIVLPCCWLALPTPGTAIESALAQLEAESGVPMWGDLGEQLRENHSGAVLELIALLPDEEQVTVPVAQVTVSVLPANGLTLEDYLAATEAQLNSIANTSVTDAYIEPTLGVDSFPASVIEYTAAPTPATTDNSEEMAGLQVAFFGSDANTLIVLTFTTTVDRFAELHPQFLHIVRTITLGEPTI